MEGKHWSILYTGDSGPNKVLISNTLSQMSVKVQDGYQNDRKPSSELDNRPHMENNTGKTTGSSDIQVIQVQIRSILNLFSLHTIIPQY